MKVILTKEYDGIPEGTVFDGELVAGPDGEPCWEGIAAINAYSFNVSVPDEHVEKYDESKHDIFYTLKEALKEKAEINARRSVKTSYVFVPCVMTHKLLAALKRKFENQK